MKTKEEIILELLEVYHNEDAHVRDTFREMREAELISLHRTLGRHIRNEYKLWENEWVPVLVDGIDCSEDHPDAISMQIITEVWKQVQ